MCSSSSVAVAFLRQEFSEELCEDFTVKQELFQLFPEQFEIYEQLKHLNSSLDSWTANSTSSLDSIKAQYSIVYNDAIKNNVFEIEARIRSILNATGFAPTDEDKLVSDFSGGWKMRVGLAKIFLQEP